MLFFLKSTYCYKIFLLFVFKNIVFLKINQLEVKEKIECNTQCTYKIFLVFTMVW